jgi:Zn-dependent protease
MIPTDGKRVGSVLGIPLNVHWSLFLGASFFSFAFSTLYSGSIFVVSFFGVTTFVAMFLSVLLHELGHALAAWHVGSKPKSITLMFFGGALEVSGGLGDTPLAAIEMAMAGPAVSLVLWLLALPLIPFGDGNVGELVKFFALINSSLLLFNLLPMAPLDGGRAVTGFIWLFKTKGINGYHEAVVTNARWIARPLIVIFVVTRLLSGNFAVYAVLLGWFLFNAVNTELVASRRYLAFEKGSISELSFVRVFNCSAIDPVSKVLGDRYFSGHEYLFARETGFSSSSNIGLYATSAALSAQKMQDLGYNNGAETLIEELPPIPYVAIDAWASLNEVYALLKSETITTRTVVLLWDEGDTLGVVPIEKVDLLLKEANK